MSSFARIFLAALAGCFPLLALGAVSGGASGVDSAAESPAESPPRHSRASGNPEPRAEPESPPSARYSFDIQPQALSAALIQFSHQSGIAIVFPDPITRAIEAPALGGEKSAGEALAVLLRGTALEWRLVDDRIIAVYDGTCRSLESCLEEEELLARHPPYVPGIEELFVVGSKVTGSRIKRNHLTGAAPVDILSAPDIELSGAQTLGELLRFVPAAAGGSTSTAINLGGDGTASVTLRGLPASSTLVLINSRRVANDGLAGESVDLNSIPPAAVARVEILKEGASAIYGSDAIGGVINIIMKEDFHGLLTEHFYGSAEEGDGETRTTTLQYGTGFRHGSLFFTASHFDQQEIAARDRAVSRDSDSRRFGGADLRSSAAAYPRVLLPPNADAADGMDGTAPDGMDGNGPANPANPANPADPANASPALVLDESTGIFRPAQDGDRFDERAYSSALVPSRRNFAYFSASYDLSEQFTIAAQGSYTDTRAAARRAPAPVFTAFAQEPFLIAADNIYNPFGIEIADARRRMTELPPRVQENRTDVWRATAILEGLHWGWHWDLAYSYSRSKSGETTTGLINAAHLRRGVGPAAECSGARPSSGAPPLRDAPPTDGNASPPPAPGGCVPINLFAPPGGVDAGQAAYLSATGHAKGESELRIWSLNASRTLAETPFGAAQFAFGVEFRREAIDLSPGPLPLPRAAPPLAQAGIIGGANFEATSGRRSVRELYGESIIPLWDSANQAQQVDLELAARWSSYSDFGATVNPKIGIRFQAVPALLLRATYGEGFRAPTLNELHQGARETHAFIQDPCAIPENVGALPGCAQLADRSLTQFLTVARGNQRLSEETSQTIGFGAVWTPALFPGLSISADFFDIDTDAIVDSSAQYLVDQNAANGRFANQVRRDARGNLALVTAANLNVGERQAKGVDVVIAWKAPWRLLGQWTTALNLSHIDEYSFQLDVDSPNRDLSGSFVDPAAEGQGGIPKYKWNLGVQWARQRWRGSYDVHYVSELKERVPGTARQRIIKDWLIHDLQFSYVFNLLKGQRISLGVDNLLNTEAPFAASALNDNIDARTHDLKGRYWYAKLSQRF